MNSVEPILKSNKIVPVVSVDNKQQALGLAGALLDGGVSVIEITLRSDYAVKAIEEVRSNLPEMLVLAGTVTNLDQLKDVQGAGVQGVITPGLSQEVVEHCLQDGMPLLAGVATPTELMKGLDYGLREFKLFPANIVGGLGMLKALGAPFPQARFCPTGGLNQENYLEYLGLSNVMCVGGSWIATSKMIEQQDWQQVSLNCQKALKLI